MSFAARLALIWLLAFALPIQGALAVTASTCRSAEPAGLSAVGAEPCEGEPEMTEAAVDPDTTAPNASASTAPDPDHAHHADGTPHKCGGTGACCVSAVSALPTVSIDGVDLGECFAPADRLAIATHVGDGPERPPRAVLV